MLTHKGTQTLQTERLVLRPFTVDDAPVMFQNWANDPRVTEFLTWAPHGTVENTTALLKRWCADYEKINCYNWVMVYQGAPIGGISVVRLSERDEWAELGYCMGYDYWNKGIMTEAVRTVMEFLFREVGINRLVIEHAVRNPGSGRVAQKCGLTLEGVKRQYFKKHDDEFLDVAQYAILKSDWMKQRKE